MYKVYFTFGSWDKFPHKNGYMVVEAEDFKDAISTYREKYPDINQNCVNCSEFYDEEQWARLECYKNEKPKEILVSKRIKKQKELVVLLENVMKMALDDCTEEDLLDGMGCTKEDLKELGVDVEDVFK